MNRIIRYFLENRLVTILLLLLLVAWGTVTAPFGWNNGFLPSDPVPVDAIPDIGENQQIVFTEWAGRSPQDIEDQVTYPLTTSLLGIPGVRTIRSSSIFGLSSIYIIFNEDVEFYWSRSRVLEKLSSLPTDLLPEGVRPSLGPDATALGQVYWYTLEGRDPDGNVTGGWDLHELRSVQDFYVKYGLSATEGVAEVASIGGFVQEYQVDVDPEAMRAYDVSLMEVMQAVRNSNRDVGAKTMEINMVEYLVRGLGYLKSLEDLELAVVSAKDNVPIRIKDIGVVTLGPASRRGALDKGGAEAVGGVVVARYGSNPLEVIGNVKDKISEIASGLPKKTLSDGTESQLTIVPFYDRTQLIQETLGTLEEALSLEILISILVIIVMVTNLRASIIISSILPIAVLMVFIAMRYFNVDANIVALSGIAIAIGTMVDLGIILSENVISHIDMRREGEKLIETIYKASAEVSSAIITAVSTTIVSFIPVFAMEAAEGKLFRPLAFTKTFALLAALVVSLLILPTLAYWLFGFKIKKGKWGNLLNALLMAGGTVLLFMGNLWAGVTLVMLGLAWFLTEYKVVRGFIGKNLTLIIVLISVTWLLAKYWLPLGPAEGALLNFLFVVLLVAVILGLFLLLEHFYTTILTWCLDNKLAFLMIPVLVILMAANIWIGFGSVFGVVPKVTEKVGWEVEKTALWSSLTHTFPGIGKEFMPSLDEGSFLYMPTSMAHAGIEQNRQTLQKLDMLTASIPEVELVVGKMGRALTALDAAPISMYENLINYKPEYAVSDKGHRQRFRTDNDGRFILTNGDTLTNEEAIAENVTAGELVADERGEYYRNWRPHINSPDDIWQEIIAIADLPGVTSAPKLQPIETRLVMLQTGMRAPMGIKVYGPDLPTIEAFGLKLEALLKEVPSVKAEAVFADRIVGKPYMLLDIDRNAIARHGLSVEQVQQTIETAIGGMKVTSTVEGRERYPVRVRYPRELRDSPEGLGKILMTTSSGAQVPLSDLLTVRYQRGPQMIKAENTFLTGYVLFDRQQGFAEVDVVTDAQHLIQERIDEGSLTVPKGVSFKFSGSYENQVRAEKRLAIIVPLVLALVFLILYFQFGSITTSLMIFSGIAMAFSGGFLMIWCYAQPWFLDFTAFGTDMRGLFQIHPINLSVAVWVGFIALFGIATDDGVLMATYLDQSFDRRDTNTKKSIRAAVAVAGQRRIRPAVMTSATTILALLPILTSAGRGSDIMIPMAIPSFGGMLVAAISYFIVPVLYSWREERKIKDK